MVKSLFQLTENELDDDIIAQKISVELEKKYNRQFIVKNIGNRYGTEEFNKATAFCTPVGVNDFVFKATINTETNELVVDDYNIKSLCYEIEEILNNEFRNLNIQLTNKVEIVGKNELSKNYSVNEFSNEFKNSSFLATIIVKNQLDKNKIYNVLEIIKNKYANIKLKCLFFIISGEDFGKCEEMAKVLPEITKAFVEQFSIIDEKIMKIANNEILELK